MDEARRGSGWRTSTVIGRPVLSTSAAGVIVGVKIPSPGAGCESGEAIGIGALMSATSHKNAAM